MNILGLTTMGESAAVLIQDGNIIAAVEEERFTRIKHEGCFPIKSVEYCLNEAGISISEVDHIAIYWQPWRVWTRFCGVIKTVISNPKLFIRKIKLGFNEFHRDKNGVNNDGSWIELFLVRRILKNNFGDTSAQIHYLDHHECHIASGFYASGFKEAITLVIDGGGEDHSTTIASCSGSKINVLRKFKWPNSLGHFYSAITAFLGFKIFDGEYKMMGLAPYSKPKYLNFFRNKILISDGSGSYNLNTNILDYHNARINIFSETLISAIGEPRAGDNEPFTERHKSIASSAQVAFEEVVMDLANWAYENGGRKKNICIVGGCGLNCTANGLILKDGPYEKIFVPPAPNDTGGALGAAFLVHNKIDNSHNFKMDHAYFGPGYSDEEIGRQLSLRSLTSDYIHNEDSLIDKTSAVLKNGKIVAWFQGRMEFGPRALGNRSFLADPRNDSIGEELNRKIKKRELFRPFAPSVLEEYISDFFEIEQNSPFMTLIAKVKKEKMTHIPAVTHINGSARIHSVSKSTNRRYWKLIESFRSKTKIPILLNTSFNIQEPIVCTPTEAIDTFLNSSVDYLVIGNHFVSRHT